ncbi:MAG: glutathione S-transferase family protein [Azospirillaceae bacterium]
MSDPIVYGPAYSTYVRSARLALEEKPVGYTLEHVGMLEGKHAEEPHASRHPFAKVPAFEHDGFTIFESGAILRYVDQVFPGASLTPADARRAARMNMVMGIVDNYGYPAILGKIVWQRLVEPMLGREGDPKIVEEGLPMAGKALSVIADIKGDDAWLAGPDISLADLHLAPIMAYLSATPEAEGLLAPHPGLKDWWQAIAARDSMLRTDPQL